MSGRILILLLAAAVGAAQAPLDHDGAEASPSVAPSVAPSPVASPAITGPPVDAPWYSSVDDNEGRSYFFVGHLSSSAFEVPIDRKVSGSGPVDGKVLAWWRDEDGTGRLALVDTATGAFSPLYERRSRSLHGALSPDGRTAWWVEQTRHRVRGVFRLDLAAGGEPERVADGWDGFVLDADWSTDGATLVLTTNLRTEEGSMVAEYEYRLLDTVAGAVSDPIDADQPGTVVGLDGDDLIYYQMEGSDYVEEPLPLVSVDVRTGEVTRLLSARENRSAQLVDDGGTPVLVADVNRDGHYALDRMTPDGSDRRPLWTSDQEWEWPSSTPVHQTEWSGVEAAGWVLVAGRSVPYPEPGREPGERLLVSVANGAVVELSPPPQISQPEEPTIASPNP